MKNLVYAYLILLIGILLSGVWQDQKAWGEDILDFMPAIIASSQKLSHGIPLTYPGYAPEFRQLRVVKTDLDTYWIGMATTSNGGSGYHLYIMQIDHLGHVRIPPFSLTEIRSVSSTDSDYQFALLPLENGGLQVLVVTEKSDEASSFAPDLLKCYWLDADGLIDDERALDHSYPYDRSEYLDGVYYEDIWAFRTKNQQTIFVAETNSENDLVYGRISDQGEVEETAVLAEDFGNSDADFVEAAFDRPTNQLYLLTHHSSSPDDPACLTKYTADGTLEKAVDISETIIQPIFGNTSFSEGYRTRLLLTDDGLLMTLPDLDDTLWLVLFDPDTLAHQSPVEVAGLDYKLRTADCRYALADAGNGEIGLAWTPLNYTEYTYSAIYTRVNLSGEVTKPPVDMTVEDMRYDPRNPRLFLDGPKATLFYGYYKSDYSTSREWHLVCRHQGRDFPAGKPDLVIAPPHVHQWPAYAALDHEIGYSVRVFNNGEAPSPASTLTLSYNGASFQQSVDVLQPGESQLLDSAFLHVPTPSYLTEMPVVSVDLPDNDWTGNNHARVPIQFPGLTPIYPQGSVLYTWTVRDSYSLEPLPRAQVSVVLPDIQTTGGSVQNVLILNESDEYGELSIRLPDGTYDFQISRYGYPSETPSIKVPSSPAYLELEPPGTLSLSFYETGTSNSLHPVPNRVFVHLDHRTDPYAYHAKGDENGLVLGEVMRGEYDCTVKAFGYHSMTTLVDITGGINNPYDITLDSLPRGSISGTVTTGSGCGISLSGARVALEGTGISCESSSGAFSLEDIPHDTYTLSFGKDGYESRKQTITIDENTPDVVASSCLPAITIHSDSIANETMLAWNRIDYFPGYISAPSYEIRTAYGVFDFSGLFSYSQAEDAADFHYVYLDISGRNWYYYSVSSEFSLTDIFCSGLNTIVDGSGDLAGFLLDHFGGDLIENFLGGAIGGGGTGGKTIVRVDRVALYDGDALLWESPMSERQEYSTDGPIDYIVPNAHTENIYNVELKAYLKLMNENYATGPLHLMDTFRFVWHYKNGRFRLNKDKTIQNPGDYPSL